MIWQSLAVDAAVFVWAWNGYPPWDWLGPRLAAWRERRKLRLAAERAQLDFPTMSIVPAGPGPGQQHVPGATVPPRPSVAPPPPIGATSQEWKRWLLTDASQFVATRELTEPPPYLAAQLWRQCSVRVPHFPHLMRVDLAGMRVRCPGRDGR